MDNDGPFIAIKMLTCLSLIDSSFQQRLSYTTLSDLALALIDGTVYEIVQRLLDIQHLTERNLYNQRQKLHCEHQGWPPFQRKRGLLRCMFSRGLYRSDVFYAFVMYPALKQELTKKHKAALQVCKQHNLALLKPTQQAEVEVRGHGYSYMEK